MGEKFLVLAALHHEHSQVVFVCAALSWMPAFALLRLHVTYTCMLHVVLFLFTFVQLVFSFSF